MNKPVTVSFVPQIRFSDIDAMGHVNNAVYLSYFEQARMQFFASLLGRDWDWEADGILLVHNELDYRRPVLLQDRITIEVWCDEVGNKSFRMNYKVRRDSDGAITTEGMSVLVCYNYREQTTVQVPDTWRKMFEQQG